MIEVAGLTRRFGEKNGSYMASTHDVEISVGLQKKLGAGIFGGAGSSATRSSSPRSTAPAMSGCSR